MDTGLVMAYTQSSCATQKLFKCHVSELAAKHIDWTHDRLWKGGDVDGCQSVDVGASRKGNSERERERE